MAKKHSDRLWKQLVLAPAESGELDRGARLEYVVAFTLAAAAAVAIKLPTLSGRDLEESGGFYARNRSVLVLPLLALYFVWKRGTRKAALIWLGAAFATAAFFANVYLFKSKAHIEALSARHLPIASWLLIGIVYAGGRWGDVARRMDFFRCGAGRAVLVASWLVEAKQSVIENRAPVLTRHFAPHFAVLLVTFLVAMLWTGRGIDVEREMLIAFDLLLVMVLGLLLYSISARDPHAPPGSFDVAQVVLLNSPLLADAAALWALAARIPEFGFSPNQVAALGMNVILLVNLAWSAVLCVRFLRRRGSLAGLERWQTGYLPVYAVWAATVVIVFPVLFEYI